MNRVYWARYPDAPTQLDSTSPEWEQWRVSWQNIWDELMENRPEPEDVHHQNAVSPEGELDLSYIKAAVREYFAAAATTASGSRSRATGRRTTSPGT